MSVSEIKSVLKGDIFYIRPTKEKTQGSVLQNRDGRPAVIVSNNANNKYSNVVEIVYMTRSPKKGLPTHFTVSGTGETSTVMCEQICSVDKSRLGAFVAHLNYDEMKALDEALAISVGLKQVRRNRNED